MNRRQIGYVVWLVLAFCLYFFENNMGTRVILLCSLLVLLLPKLRTAFFSADEKKQGTAANSLTIRAFLLQETDEPGDIRTYRLGDPIRLIHWKLSAKKDELLIREMTLSKKTTIEKRKSIIEPVELKKRNRAYFSWGLIIVLVLCPLLILLIPEANRGARVLCNWLFTASEAVNAYKYAYFTVSENQRILLTVFLLILFLVTLTALIILSHSRLLTLIVMAVCTLFQIYFGLSFPTWVNILLYGLMAIWMMRYPFHRKTLLVFGLTIVFILLLTNLLFPGIDMITETASETVRDRLSELAHHAEETIFELPEGEMETRHVHNLSLITGRKEAQINQEYRLVTEEEQMISMPHWVNWMKIILFLLLTVALVVLPFVPFLFLNVKEKKIRELRKAFSSKNTSEAVCSIFQQVIGWLEEANGGAGNRLYRNWTDALPDGLPEGYTDRFLRCAEDFEEAAYSEHILSEEMRQRALALLQETKTILWQRADWKQRFRLKYWKCLCE